MPSVQHSAAMLFLTFDLFKTQPDGVAPEEFCNPIHHLPPPLPFPRNSPVRDAQPNYSNELRTSTNLTSLTELGK
jgi:hypothetical protein